MYTAHGVHLYRFSGVQNWSRRDSAGFDLRDYLDLVIMVIQMNIAEAKAKLSELLDAAAKGREVVIARSGTAVARLVPIEAPASRELGFFPAEIPDELFEPMDNAALAEWE